MRNSQLKPAYKVQIAVDAEYIVATEIFNDRTDENTFIPFMEKIKNIKWIYLKKQCTNAKVAEVVHV